jgi:hypothetical protein
MTLAFVRDGVLLGPVDRAVGVLRRGLDGGEA